MIDLSIAVDLCKHFEGFKSKPYLCPAGVPTIGYGATYYTNGNRVSLDDQPITKDKASSLLLHELQNTYLPGVLRLCPILAMDNKKLNAIVDFSFNLGLGRLQTSTLRRKINAKDWEGAKIELSRWVRAGGKILPGLVARRRAEIELI